MSDAKDYAVHVIGPGFQIVLRVPGFEDVEGVCDCFLKLLDTGGTYRGAKEVVRFGPGMYCNVLSEWAEHEEKQKAAAAKQQELEALQRRAIERQVMVMPPGSAPGSRIMRGR